MCECKDSGPQARIPYLIILFLGTILALVLRYWGEEWVIDLYVYKKDACTETCLGYNAAYRVSFCLTLFFLTHALFLLGKGISVHTGMWCCKILTLIGAIIVSFFVPNDFFDVYAIIARFVAGIFLLLQIIIFVDFAYAWQENWLSEEKNWRIPFVVVSVLFYGASLTMCIFSFDWFTDDDGGSCSRNKIFVSFTLIVTFVFTVIANTEWCEHGNMLTSGVVTLYSWYLLYSALSADPSQCNTIDGNDTFLVILGMILAGVAVCYAGWNLSNARSLFGDEEETLEHDEEAAVDNDVEMVDKTAAHKSGSTEALEEESPHIEAYRKQNLRFHLVMAITAMYVAMLLTNWGVETDSSSTSYDLGEETVWIRIVTQWLTMGLFFWSLIAPKVLSNREF